MPDVVVTVPKGMWLEWIAEGDLPGEAPPRYDSHFWIANAIPQINSGERVYIVAHRKLRGYAPLVSVERHCRLSPNRACLLRRGGAVAVTLDVPVVGFQGWRYRWWNREDEKPFPDWKVP